VFILSSFLELFHVLFTSILGTCFLIIRTFNAIALCVWLLFLLMFMSQYIFGLSVIFVLILYLIR